MPYDTFYHVCTQKTASQWIRLVLSDPAIYSYTGLIPKHFNQLGLNKAKRAPPLRKWQFGCHYYLFPYHIYSSNNNSQRFKVFFIMRDPRDLVVSWYFSALYSHKMMSIIPQLRYELEQKTKYEGLHYLIDFLSDIGTFDCQLSWTRKARYQEGLKIFYYENLSKNSSEFIIDLLNFLQVNMPSEAIRRLCVKYEWRQLNNNRRQGVDESILKHNRKGISGDYINHLHDSHIDHLLDRHPDLINELEYDNQNFIK